MKTYKAEVDKIHTLFYFEILCCYCANYSKHLARFATYVVCLVELFRSSIVQ